MLSLHCRRCLKPYQVTTDQAVGLALSGRLPVCPSCTIEEERCPFCPGTCDCRVVPQRKTRHGERDEHRMVRLDAQPGNGV